MTDFEYWREDVCENCGNKLPADPKPGTPEFDGFCSVACQREYEANEAQQERIEKGWN